MSYIVGMGDSKEFAEGLYDALARRKGLNPEQGITKEQLHSFWDEITNQDLDSRLQIFFDMYKLPMFLFSFKYSALQKSLNLVIFFKVRQEWRW